jgi:hypothetical protein
MRVKTSDGHTIEVSEKLRNASDFMKDADDVREDDVREDDDELFLQHVTARQLELAQAFVDLITDDAPLPQIHTPFVLEDLENNKTFADFFRQIDTNEVLELIIAADFLGMEDLVQILSGHVTLLAARGQLRPENLKPELL